MTLIRLDKFLASRGAPVTELRRLSIGALSLDGGSVPGQFRQLDKNDLCKVFMGR